MGCFISLMEKTAASAWSGVPLLGVKCLVRSLRTPSWIPTARADFPTQLTDSAISGPTIDFDKDGIPNLLEYLLSGNPTLLSSGLLPTVSKAPGSNSLVFTYKRKIAATGVTQVIEHSTTLSPPWTAAVHGASGVTIITAAVPNDTTAEQATVTIPSTSTSRFVRLKAIR